MMKSGQRSSDTGTVGARLALLQTSQDETFPYETVVDGRAFLVCKDVFAPKYFESTEVFSARFPYRSADILLEMGCGCGATSVLAALKGATRVLALDRNPAAVRNTGLNIERYGLTGLVEVRKSYLFSSLSGGETFATIYWNTPWVYAPSDFFVRSELEFSVVDPGYRAIKEFFHGAGKVLLPGGRLLVGFGSFGKTEELETIAQTAGFKVVDVIATSSSLDPGVELMLYHYERSPGR